MEKYFAKTLMGLEDLLVEELKACGAKNVEKEVRGASFEADQEILYRVHYISRFAIRVSKEIFTFHAKDPEELYKNAIRLNWKYHIDLDKTFAISHAVNSKFFTHSQYAALKLKDAIVDHFRIKKGRRPNVNVKFPDTRLLLHINDDHVRISLDLTGKSLHQRGFRPAQTVAPLNEVLAAGMIALSGWDKETSFLDPMCGSGTLTLEAIMTACNIPSQFQRHHFDFMNLEEFDEEIWKKVVSEEKAKIKKVDTTFRASDITANSLKELEASLKRIPVDVNVKIKHQDFFMIQRAREKWHILLNPPYDERIKTEDVDELYGQIGNKLKHDFAGCSAWIISSNMDALKHIGLKPSTKVNLKNGKLDCKYQGFEMHEGKRKEFLKKRS
ncbi:MAG: THUMP domain-containing class I SAM-dependent RNA methyltransferase [Flavobacteriales bacterium]